MRFAASKYVGEIGENISIDGKLILVSKQINPWGEAFFVNKVIQNSDLIVFIGTKEIGAQGDRVRLQAEIAKHREYKGKKQTLIKNPKIQPKQELQL